MPGRRGAAPTPFPAEYDEVLGGYAAALEAAPLSADTRRTYVSRVRQYLAWLHRDTSERRFGGDPLAVPGVRDWAVRDYRRHLLRFADPKRSVRYCNNALAALDDFYTRLGTGKADIARDDLPRAAPRALGANAQIRWLRAVRQWPHVRDRALALSPFYAGLRIGDAVALDVDDGSTNAADGLAPAGSVRCSSTAAAAVCPSAVQAISLPPSPRKRALRTRPPPTSAGTRSSTSSSAEARISSSSRRSPGMPALRPSPSTASPPTTTSTAPCATSPSIADPEGALVTSQPDRPGIEGQPATLIPLQEAVGRTGPRMAPNW